MKKELYCGFDVCEFNKIRDVLDAKGIKHTYKIADSNHTELVMAGMRTDDVTKQYYIYVSSADFEAAQTILHEEL